MPRIEVEDFPLGTDAPVFWYDNALVHRDEREALRYLLDELTALHDEVQRAIMTTLMRQATLNQEREERS